jgi:site-specific DNA recombinase
VRRWNPAQEWVVSATVVHPPIVSEQDFIAAQAINAVAGTQDGSAREYLLVGLVQCGHCGRRMESHWVHGWPGYRCRHGHNSSKSALPGRARNLYLRETASWPVQTQLCELGLHDGADSAMAGRDLRDALTVLHDRDLVIRCDPGACIVTSPRGLL